MFEEGYWLCFECATKKGGVWPEGHCATVIIDDCPYCKKEGATVIPWVDFNWPDKNTDKIARDNRD